jgi:hypothetical protein
MDINSVLGMLDTARREALSRDQISMSYSEVRAELKCSQIMQTMQALQNCLSQLGNFQSENIMLRALLVSAAHVLASSDPHKTLVEDKLRDGESVLDLIGHQVGREYHLEGPARG